MVGGVEKKKKNVGPNLCDRGREPQRGGQFGPRWKGLMERNNRNIFSGTRERYIIKMLNDVCLTFFQLFIPFFQKNFFSILTSY